MSTTNKTGAISGSSGAPTIITFANPYPGMITITVRSTGSVANENARLARNGQATDPVADDVLPATGVPYTITEPGGFTQIALYPDNSETDLTYAIMVNEQSRRGI